VILVNPLLFPPVAAAARGRIAVSFLITLKVQYLIHPRVRLCMGGIWVLGLVLVGAYGDSPSLQGKGLLRCP